MSTTGIAPVGVPDDIVAIDGPRRFGSELRWIVRVGELEGVLAQLAPELAADPSIRTRWIADTQRMVALDVPGHCRPTRTGPDAGSRDVDAAPPWRLRPRASGTPLDEWLARRAPAPCDEVVALVAEIARCVGRVHAAGAIIRDLAPRNVVVGDDGVTLVDIGLSRTDVLSSRTAASLMVEDSPYAAPELLRRSAVDRRADVYSLGVMAYVALTGVPPWGDRGAVLRPAGPPAGVRTLRPAVPLELEQIVDACLAEDPGARPDGTDALCDALEGRDRVLGQRPRTVCQACGASMRLGQRLCLGCGRTVVQFVHAQRDAADSCAVVLTKAAEDAAFMASLRGALGAVAQGPLPTLNILVGDERLYSKREREQMLRLPLRLFDDLAPTTAAALAAHLERAGLRTKVVPHRSTKGRRHVVSAAILGATVLIAGVLIVVGVPITAAMMVIVIGVVAGLLTMKVRKRAIPQPEALARLRAAPAALPASDPWVSRLAALLGADTAADVRDQVGELALAVQRLVDHRLEHVSERALPEQREFEVVTAPVESLVRLIEAEVRAIAAIDRETRPSASGRPGETPALDEGEIVRSIARSEARGEPEVQRAALRSALQRLRVLEDQRAAAMHRLLDAAGLLRRAVSLGLGVRDPDLEHRRLVAASLAALVADGSPTEPSEPNAGALPTAEPSA